MCELGCLQVTGGCPGSRGDSRVSLARVGHLGATTYSVEMRAVAMQVVFLEFAGWGEWVTLEHRWQDNVCTVNAAWSRISFDGRTTREGNWVRTKDLKKPVLVSEMRPSSLRVSCQNAQDLRQHFKGGIDRKIGWQKKRRFRYDTKAFKSDREVGDVH